VFTVVIDRGISVGIEITQNLCGEPQSLLDTQER
jgi:hypothetical protein